MRWLPSHDLPTPGGILQSRFLRASQAPVVGGSVFSRLSATSLGTSPDPLAWHEGSRVQWDGFLRGDGQGHHLHCPHLVTLGILLMTGLSALQMAGYTPAAGRYMLTEHRQLGAVVELYGYDQKKSDRG